jgi:hypothetical protein
MDLKASAGTGRQVQILNAVRKCVYIVSNLKMFAGLQDGQEKKRKNFQGNKLVVLYVFLYVQKVSDQL